jgi:hypothetical protein
MEDRGDRVVASGADQHFVVARYLCNRECSRHAAA